MHRWILLLLIALLPLRGWVGDAMAGEMVAQHVAAVQAQAAGFQKMPTGAQTPLHGLTHQDCAEHAQAASGAFDGAAPAGMSDCATCASCQVCSSVALTSTLEAGPAALAASAQPALESPPFASADAAPDLRPPIY